MWRHITLSSQFSSSHSVSLPEIFALFCSVSDTSLPLMPSLTCPSPPPLSLRLLLHFSLSLSLPSFHPSEVSCYFSPRRKYCSELLLAEMVLLFQNPLGVENTCSSVLRRAEGNWINRSFFPTLEIKWREALTQLASVHVLQGETKRARNKVE